jgi:aerobic-type carbon monoxide dehydrogenase small subunit (CoxS/CutS family)
MDIEFQLNGERATADIRPSMSLADMVRESFGLTGTHLGCEQGVCGACSVLVDGVAMRSCLMLAVQADGREITTVEGLAAGRATGRLAEGFLRHRAFQCGFCTPGMMVTLAEVLQGYDSMSRQDLGVLLSGNICRCTGYEPILDAACEALADNGQLELQES